MTTRASANQPSKRRFQFVSDGSGQFWTVGLAGSNAFVTYGRIGSPVPTRVKPFPDRLEAVRFGDKMVRDELAKGHSEVPPSDHPGAPETRPEVVTC